MCEAIAVWGWDSTRGLAVMSRDTGRACTLMHTKIFQVKWHGSMYSQESTWTLRWGNNVRYISRCACISVWYPCVSDMRVATSTQRSGPSIKASGGDIIGLNACEFVVYSQVLRCVLVLDCKCNKLAPPYEWWFYTTSCDCPNQTHSTLLSSYMPRKGVFLAW